MNAMRDRSADSFRQHLLEKYSLPLRAHAHVDKSANPAITRPLRELWEATDLSAADFADEVSDYFALPRLSLPQLLAATPRLDGFSRRFLRESTIFPFSATSDVFRLAVADPSDTAAIRAAEIVFGTPVDVVVASYEDITTVLDQRTEAGDAKAEDGVRSIAQQSDDDIESLRDLASGAPVVRALNDLLERAVELRASDIHVEPFRAGLTVRMRVDGLLRALPSPHGIPPQALISRIKILASLNIAERRLPQDGAARVRVGRGEIDVRVATMPTQHGESAVIRLLPRDRGLLEMGKLGLAAHDERAMTRLLAMPHGMIVITGPTGSGKTTTLATMLSILNEPTRKILTIEDPVEYEIPGINQSQVKPSIGLTFASAMRAFVRQDPDVIMVGEVRDAETAHIAIHAALTGHLVLTTLHTETAAAAVPRLIDLGIEGFLLKSTLRAVVAQRLVRMLCDRCKVPHTLTEADLAKDPRFAVIGFKCGEVVHEAGGCERCGGTGYRGRNGVFEILEMSDEVRTLIGPQTDSHSIDAAAMRGGMTTMLEDAVAKCRAGLTTVPEVFRVTTVR
ncbi:type II/IV secretion system protein [Bradyrhizobium japonicum]|uniref:GspE/PulE family protein n=2 Tax=Nitrobacteraceae TaxID=41294 RepID=UPI000231CA45|nr:ATPase, T2SS/T4P/T4SS family [Bradyrhizobium japonicum]AJA61990.1 general secretion pathway protein GspE [Bradyrhizobium japonicum]KMK00844.1 general secretion pathway protein GspE [Bradyrhizobium japonicum]MBR0759564.1 Flp pilus assembly complex ATPase component TadA [Bradyrhizobium japonicum]MYV81159.1 type II/IV secretion system protein [Bradyrhizobium japonicum]BAL08952.1 general secretion pathway protein E [Bradyrhizobium japonicum USDA 6]